MQNSGLKPPLEGAPLLLQGKPALALEATGLSANRGPEGRKVANPQQDVGIVYGKTGIEGMKARPDWKAQNT